MSKRAADSGEPGTSSSGHEDSPIQFHTHLEDYGAPVAKKFTPDMNIKQENPEMEQSGALSRHIKEERRDGDEEEENEEEEEHSPIPVMEDDEEEEEDDAESIIDKTDIPSPTHTYLDLCVDAKLPDDVAIGAWEMYYHAFQRVSLEFQGSENAWQASAIYYYFLARGVKRHGKPSRLLMQHAPISMLAVIRAFDVSVMEVLDKTVRFIEIMHSRKMRRFLDYIRRIQESLAVSCIIFKKFVAVYFEMFNDVRVSTSTCPSTDELFSLLWTSFLILKTRVPTDDLVTNYHLMFSMLDQFYAEMCAMKDGVIHHLNQKFVTKLIDTDSTILRSLCNRFEASVLDTRHFCDHVYKKMDKTGLPSSWNFLGFKEFIKNTTNDVYTDYLLRRASIDERIFIPKAVDFPNLCKLLGKYDAAATLKVSATGKKFEDADFLNHVANSQCLDKIALSQQKSGAERMLQAKEQPRVPPMEYSLEIGTYPEDANDSDTHARLRRIICRWELETSQLQKICDQMSDNPMATLLLKRDVLTEKFERKLSQEARELTESVLQRFHHGLRIELEKVFLVFIEKIMVAEVKKKVREEDLLNVIRREEFLDSVFCFCVELTLFSNDYKKAFPWSAWLCDIHPFQFHRIIDLMINHEKTLSRSMVQHFSRIEEHVIDYYAWKADSPLWPMLVRCPFSHFQEFGEDWNDKLSMYSPMKFTPMKTDDSIRDDLGRPVVPNNQSSRTLRIFLKRTFFTAARRLHDLTDRISMGERAKNQTWSLFDYLLRHEPLIFMDRHLDQILLCCVYVIMKVNLSSTTFNEIMAQYRRQAKDASFVYRNVTVFKEQLAEHGFQVNTKETVRERLEAPQKERVTVNLIKYYNIEFRDRIKYIIGHLDQASDEELQEMPLPTSYGLLPVRVQLTDKVSIQMLPKTSHGTSKQEMAIAELEITGVNVELHPGRVAVSAD